MKNQYETPKAKKVEFDYTENVTASGDIIVPSKTATKCSGTCSQTPYQPVTPGPGPGFPMPIPSRYVIFGIRVCWF